MNAELTEKHIDALDIRMKELSVEEDTTILIEGARMVRQHLDLGYKISKQCVSFEKVGYLPEGTFTSLGVFNKLRFRIPSFFPGVTCFLLLMSPKDIVEGLDDFSIIDISRRRKSYLMLGPLFL